MDSVLGAIRLQFILYTSVHKKDWLAPDQLWSRLEMNCLQVAAALILRTLTLHWGISRQTVR